MPARTRSGPGPPVASAVVRRPLPPSLAALAATLAAVVALALPAAVAAAPADLAAQTDPTVPAPTASTAPDPGAEGPTESTITGGEVVVDETEAAQDQADEDLQAVWVVVYALAAVAVGLLVLLVVYVRATNPERAAARREERLLAARARAREEAGLPPEDPEVAAAAVAAEVGREDEPDEQDEATGATATSAVGAPDADVEGGSRRRRRRPREDAPALSLPGLEDDPTDAAGPTPPLAPPAGPAVAPAAAGVLAVRAGAADAAEARARAEAPAPGAVPAAGPTAPPRPPDAPVRTRRSQAPPPAAVPPPRPPEGARPPAEPAEEPPVARPARSHAEGDGASAPDLPPAVLSRQDDRDGSEGVKLITDAGAPSPAEVRPASAPRRPRRVKAPAKKLGTPDAERILVRPGQAPVRVPITPKPVEAVAGPTSDRPEAEADEAGEPDPGAADPSSEAGDGR